MRYRLVILAAACAAVAGLAWLARPALAQGDTPIIVRDGSIIIEPDQGNLSAWSMGSNDRMIAHPNATRRLDDVQPSGGGAVNDTCRGKGDCRLVFTWSDGSTLSVRPQGAQRGLLIETSTPYTDSSWDRSGASWRRTLPAGTKFTNVTIEDRGSGTGQPREICRGQGCTVRIFYR